MPNTIEFPFSNDEALPTISIILSYADPSIFVDALLDTGSTINVLPYEIGLQSPFSVVLQAHLQLCLGHNPFVTPTQIWATYQNNELVEERYRLLYAACHE